ncbi:hypothetical protein [Shewanella sp. 10N.286.52.C2]|uniref:aldose epimerase family protein n=1 Tax=Shewanella sp. 10N.286.52.C2 TaxID=1880838 RepID=UPI000C820148|nr:hypothetical protein [Shewanella sp. 10N.286.52.C2]
MVSLQKSIKDGFELITIANNTLSFTVVPAIGAKIISLKSMLTGREWLEQPQGAHAFLKQPNYGESFVNGFDCGGWDECFPSINGEQYALPALKHVSIPDHGELWCLPWQVTEIVESSHFISLTLRCLGKQLPYVFTRTLTLAADANHIDIQYQLTNSSDHQLPFVWSMHPIFAAEKGMTIALSTVINRFRTDSGFKAFFNTDAMTVQWPYESQQQDELIHLDRVLAPDSHFACKLYSDDLSTGAIKNQSIEVALVEPPSASGAYQQRCGFRYRSHDISHFGLWLNYRGWSGSDQPPAYVVGLEPCLGGADSLNEAIKRDDYYFIKPNSKRNWSVQCFIV